MAEIHYLISDASKKVDVESHVLRYWEEELELSIPRNEMGHRFYTDYHIRLFRQVKSLKEKGYQLKAIKAALAKTFQDGKTVISGEILEEDVIAALKGRRRGKRPGQKKKQKADRPGRRRRRIPRSKTSRPLTVTAWRRFWQRRRWNNSRSSWIILSDGPWRRTRKSSARMSAIWCMTS